MRLLHHPDDARQCSLLAHLCSTKAQSALLKNCTCQNFIHSAFQSGSRLACYHGFVNISTVSSHKAFCPCDIPVHRNLLPRPHFKNIAQGYCRERDFINVIASHNTCRLGLQAHQRPDARSCSVLSPLFQQSSRQDKRDYHDRSIEEGVECWFRMAEKQGHHSTIDERDGCRESHQCIHVGRLVAQLPES